jgi:hypothetical protein
VGVILNSVLPLILYKEKWEIAKKKIQEILTVQFPITVTSMWVGELVLSSMKWCCDLWDLRCKGNELLPTWEHPKHSLQRQKTENT